MSVFVFDGDDTLWHVEYKYSQAYADFFSFLYKILGAHVPSLPFVYKLFFSIEDKNVKGWGIRRGRVSESMAETYKRICAWAKLNRGVDLYNPRHEEEIRAIGNQPFDVTQHYWIEGAEDVLEELKNGGHTLCLLSKYDKTVWPEKARFLRTSRFFKDEYIRLVDGRKEMSDFECLYEKAAPRKNVVPFTVGNGEGDMIPVEYTDFWLGFYIPLPSSAPTEKDARITNPELTLPAHNSPRVVTLKKISEILNFI